MTDEAAPNLGGRPTAYRPEFVEQARKLALLGAIDREIADFFKVTDRTLYTWKHVHPDFAEALKIGKEAADDRVEQALYRRALGYSHDAVKIMTVDGSVVQEPYVEHFPPDTAACRYWLNNRRSAIWRDKQDVELTGKDGGPIDIRGGVSGLLAAAKLAVADDPGAT